MPKRGKPQAQTFDGKSKGCLTSRQRNNSISAFWKQPNGTMQPQKLDEPRAISSFYIRVCPQAPATVRRPLSVPPLEPGEKCRVQLERAPKARSSQLDPSVPGYDGEAVGGKADCCRRASPPCHRGPTLEGVSQVSPERLQGDTSVTASKCDVVSKELTIARLFQRLQATPGQKLIGVSQVSPDRRAPDLLLGVRHE